MNNSNSANNALLHYIDSLLLDIDAPESRSKKQASDTVCFKNDEAKIDDVAESVPNREVLRFLLFKAAAIPLAISFAAVEAVVEVERAALKRDKSNDGMSLSLFRYRGREIHVLDAREIILPSEHPLRHTNEEGANGHILILKDAACGLSCDDVGESVEVNLSNVEWRLQRPTRLWLAGMMKEYNHALLDEKEIINIIRRMLNSIH